MSQENAIPNSLDILLEQADTCFAQKDHAGAIPLLEKALELTNNHPTILAALGTQLFLTDHYKRASEVFGELTKIEPENTEAHIQLAIASYHNGDSNSCSNSLNSALDLDPSNADALRLSADLSVAEGHYEEARQKYQEIAEKHGISVQSLHALAYCQFKTGDYARAENTYEQLLEFDAKDDLAHDNLKAVRLALTKEPVTSTQDETKLKKGKVVKIIDHYSINV